MTRIRCSNAPSAARSFLQLAHRSYSSTATQSSTPLEFLFPRCAPSASRNAKVSATSSRAHAHARNINLRRTREFGIQLQLPSRRHFSSSPAWQQTRSILNTQKDEDGNEMMLEITSRAAKVRPP
ncbi:Iron-sulfur cluster assembly 2 like protein, mitochondrial [Ilyonectria robusta]